MSTPAPLIADPRARGRDSDADSDGDASSNSSSDGRRPPAKTNGAPSAGGFGTDGEPEYRPRKVHKQSSSDDSSETSEGADADDVEEDEDEDVGTKKIVKKSSTERQGGDAKRRSSSDSSSDSEGDAKGKSVPEDSDSDLDQAPDSLEPIAEVRKQEENKALQSPPEKFEEFSKEELALSKRDTVLIAEGHVVKAQEEVHQSVGPSGDGAVHLLPSPPPSSLNNVDISEDEKAEMNMSTSSSSSSEDDKVQQELPSPIKEEVQESPKCEKVPSPVKDEICRVQDSPSPVKEEATRTATIIPDLPSPVKDEAPSSPQMKIEAEKEKPGQAVLEPVQLDSPVKAEPVQILSSSESEEDKEEVKSSSDDDDAKAPMAKNVSSSDSEDDNVKGRPRKVTSSSSSDSEPEVDTRPQEVITRPQAVPSRQQEPPFCPQEMPPRQQEIPIPKQEAVTRPQPATASHISQPPVPINRKVSSSESEPEKVPEVSKPSYVTQASNRISAHQQQTGLSDRSSERRLTPSPTSQDRANITKMYTQAVQSNNNNVCKTESTSPKFERKNLVKDITQMYAAQTLAKASPPQSPKVSRNRPSKDITQLYTGKLEEPTTSQPSERLNPRKHNMSTAVDRDGIRSAYDDVRADTSDTEWAVFKFDGNSLGVTGTGKGFQPFKEYFGNEDRGFGYIRITTGDELSKRAKFVFVTWVGPSVSVMKKAKMSTDKALMKDIIQNFSVELQLENHSEFSQEQFKVEVDKAAGARYGTGVRDL